MTYTVKEILYTLQGEGAQSGRPAIFCRFAGCNLWSGREEDRYSSKCQFCDTDFVGTDGPGGGKFANAAELAEAIAREWPHPRLPRTQPYVVCTGGEPLLQVNEELVHALHMRGFEVAIETNGTLSPPAGIDWICVSPKSNADIILREGQELKLVYPQPDAPPENFINLRFDRYYLQPKDGPELQQNIRLALEYCLHNPQWRLSLQTHKILRIP